MRGALDADGLRSTAFLDGYLLRVLQGVPGELGAALSPEDRAWVAGHGRGVPEHEAAVAEYLLAHLHGPRPVLHAGIGAGSLACLLAARGLRVIGVEAETGRARVAGHLRAAVVGLWPAAGPRYRILNGRFPAVPGPEAMRNAVLVVTQLTPATPTEEEAILDAARRYADVVLDLGRFGRRETEAERTALLDRALARGFVVAAALPGTAGTQVHLRKP